MDFGLLPPEINSGRMYAGPGSGPMIAAAAAWDDVAAQLHVTAASHSSVISSLTAGWRGPSSVSMAAAAAPHTAWMIGTAAQAEQTATQARAAVSAYETAFAATVPPPVITANRALLMALIATNLLGQNTSAIAATEAHYAEMWAQDAAAMYGYADSSSTASQLTPFRPPAQTTNPAGPSAAVAQAAATSAQTSPQLASTASQTLQSLATSSSTTSAADSPSTTLLQAISYSVGAFNPTKLYDPLGSYYDEGIQVFLARFNNSNLQLAYADALSRAGLAAGVHPGTGMAGGAVSAGMGRAGEIGSLSVPQSWASAAPEVRPVALVVPGNNLGAVPATLAGEGEGNIFSNMALSGLAGRGATGTGATFGTSVGGGAVSGGSATTATIIVIPED